MASEQSTNVSESTLSQKAEKPGLGCGPILVVAFAAGMLSAGFRGNYADYIGNAFAMATIVPTALVVRGLTRQWWQPVWIRYRHNVILAPVLWLVLGIAWTGVGMMVPGTLIFMPDFLAPSSVLPVGSPDPITRPTLAPTRYPPTAMPRVATSTPDLRLYVAVDALTVRAGPGSEHEIVGYLERCDVFTPAGGREGDWIRGASRVGAGYVNTQYLSSTSDCAPAGSGAVGPSPCPDPGLSPAQMEHWMMHDPARFEKYGGGACLRWLRGDY